MTDPITKRHLDRARIRAAPWTVAGAGGLYDSYPLRQSYRSTQRALAIPLEDELSLATLQETGSKLAQHAVRLGLKAAEQPLLALHGDPAQLPPHEWRWSRLLPVHGVATPAPDSGLSTARVHGGSYLESVTTKGLGDLANLYAYFLGELLPSRSHALTRPIIYHRVLGGLAGEDPAALTIAVFIPIQFSLDPPPRLITRGQL